MLPTQPIKLILFVAVLLLFTSCKKTNDSPTDNNRVDATITTGNGTIYVLKAKGPFAEMGCDRFAQGAYVIGTSTDKPAIKLNISTYHCATKPGLYEAIYELRVDKTGYRSIDSLSNMITYTRSDSLFLEGHFHAVCFGVNDSVAVDGTFQGRWPR